MTTPNIIFILSDDHGMGDVSCYHGSSNVQTPNIDRIATAGIRLTQCYANSSVCSPSRAALMTGRYPDMVGVPGVIRTHADQSLGYFYRYAVILPQMLRRAGYHCTLIGKWHLGLEDENHPRRRGFQVFRGFLGDMMDDYYTHLRHGFNYMRDDLDEINPQGHATELFTDWAVETINEHAGESAPFFLYLAYNAPHTPIQPPPEWIERVREREPAVDEKRARYVAMVEHMDAGIGRVLDAVEAAGLSENTLIIYASDNGGDGDAGACNEPFRGQKGQMYEGGIRVPCCAMWPGGIPAGQVSHAVTMLMDWFPTLCDVASVWVSHAVDGKTMLPLLKGEATGDPERFCYWVRREAGYGPDATYLALAFHAVRRGNMKLLSNSPFAPLELYDIHADTQETSNLAGQGHVAQRLLEQDLQARIHAAGSVPWTQP